MNNKKVKIVLVAGTRPNFVKVAPLLESFQKIDAFEVQLIHTGQHYDSNMSDIFFKQLSIKEPDFYLGVGSGSHAQQTARIMIEFEKILIQEKPDLVIVVGDVNSTLACAIVTKKLHIMLAHVEAGLRSFDIKMPEELNRIVTDRISDLLFVTEESGRKNLLHEGVDEKKIFFVGNVMIDSLKKVISRLSVPEYLRDVDYGLVTMHRPENVDNRERLREIINALKEISQNLKLFFPIHPRTRKNMERFGILDLLKDANILFGEPIGYIDFLGAIKGAKVVFTDSGGIQEETTVLGIPCITLRENTERPVTVTHGTNIVVGTKKHDIIAAFYRQISNPKQGTIPPLWDGNAADRITKILTELIL